jgi:hypothetical protein
MDQILTSPPSLTIGLPERTIELHPAPRTQLQTLRNLLLELQCRWLELRFSTGELVAEDAAWAQMQACVALLPRSENPAVLGFDLDLISNDYAQLEQLFFADTAVVQAEELHHWAILSFDLDRFVGARIVRLHGFNPRSLLEAADALRLEREQKKAAPS